MNPKYNEYGRMMTGFDGPVERSLFGHWSNPEYQQLEQESNIMEETKVYFKVTLPGDENGFVETKEGIMKLLDAMESNLRENDDVDSYEIRAIEMTETEFNNLPDFRGF